MKVRPRTIGFDVISAPISRAEPVMTENTPAGIPARSASSASASAESGVSAAGLQTKAQPAASAGPALRVIIALGKVPRRDRGDDADRLLDHHHARRPARARESSRHRCAWPLRRRIR